MEVTRTSATEVTYYFVSLCSVTTAGVASCSVYPEVPCAPCVIFWLHFYGIPLFLWNLCVPRRR